MNMRVTNEPCCATGACTRRSVFLRAGDVRLLIDESCPSIVADGIVEHVQRFLDAATEAPLWAAELAAMAQTFVDAHAARVEAGATHVLAVEETLVAALRDAAANPPDCEEAFRFRLCMVMDWHPRTHRGDLDAAVTRARARKIAVSP